MFLMSTAFQCDNYFKNTQRETAPFTTNVEGVHCSLVTTVSQAEEWHPELLAQHGPDAEPAQLPSQGPGSRRKHLHLGKTLGSASKTCLGPGKEVETTPETGGQGRGGGDWLMGSSLEQTNPGDQKCSKRGEAAAPDR